MTMQSWLRQLFTRAPRSHHKLPRRSRLGLEALEDRWTPSTFAVLNTLDDGAGSLRWAVAQANSNAGADTIAFATAAFSTPKTITLTSGQLTLTDSSTTTISGPGVGLTIDGNGAGRVFAVEEGASAALSKLTLTGGVSDNGGGIANFGELAMTECTVSGNTADQYSRGGGIYNLGTATLTNCTISGNYGQYTGGGVHNGGTLTLSGCTIAGNSTYLYGGGIYNQGEAMLANCTVSGNFTNYGGGGGITAWSSLTMTNCTVYGNSSRYTSGGGLLLGGTTTLTNCTVSGNSAGTSGAGVINYGTATLVNTIVAGNGVSNLVNWGDLSGHNNLVGPVGLFEDSGLVNGVDGNIVGVADPLLASLGDYGGATQTMALLPGSLAIGAGASGADVPATDQRGRSRFGGTDIGAFESQGFTFTAAPGGSPQSANIGTAFANPLVVNVAANDATEPIEGGVVRFKANPGNSGAAAFFFNSTGVIPTATASIVNGQASIEAAPNNALGSYTVVTSNPGSSVSFALTNTGQVFAKLEVNTTSDALFPGGRLLSLRQALAFANSAPTGAQTITFSSTAFATPKTIALSGGQLELYRTIAPVAIVGPWAGVTLDAGGHSRVFQVNAGVTASFSKLTLTGGQAENGGGMFNLGTATLTNCTITGNTGTSDADTFYYSGGGINNSGTATLINCTVSGNTARVGGGMSNVGTATLTNCTITGNSASLWGGGFSNLPYATVTLTNCTVSGNSASSVGGGLRLWSSAATLTNCTISGNTALRGGGVFCSYGLQTKTLTNCTISGNTAQTGGGLYFRASTQTLTNCTISGNTATSGSGGGLLFSITGPSTLTNCTISGNSAATVGGGVFNHLSKVTLTSCRVSGNSAASGGGIAVQGPTYITSRVTSLTVTSSLIQDNRATTKGGGISSTGKGIVTLTSTVLSGNTVTSTTSAQGGGINIENGGTLSLANCVVNANQANGATTAQGGGIYASASTVSVQNSVVNANQANGATAQGGGIYARNSTLTVQSSTVNGNKANGTTLGQGGGIYAFDTVLTILASIVQGNKASTAFDNIYSGP